MWMSVTNLCNVLTLRLINALDKRGEKSGDLLVGYFTVYILVLCAKKIFLVFLPVLLR